jgi:tetratricopeptide (TPR) repeat protein
MSLPLKEIVLSVALTLAVLLCLSDVRLLADDYADGVAAFDRKEYAKAVRLLTDAVEQNPNNADAFVARGTTYQRIYELDNALADYDAAIRINPKHVAAFNGRGSALHDKGEYENAIAEFDEAIRLDPKNPTAYVRRGSVWNSEGELDKALVDFDKAIRLDPKNAEAYFHRGGTWEWSHKLDKALADYDAAIRLDPKSIVAREKRAWIRATSWDDNYRDGAKAVADATKVIEDASKSVFELTDWRHPYRLCMLAAAYAESGEFDKAVEWQEKAIELVPDDDDFPSRLKLYQAKKPYREEPK